MATAAPRSTYATAVTVAAAVVCWFVASGLNGMQPAITPAGETPARQSPAAEEDAAVPNLFQVDRIAGRRLKLAEQRVAVGEFGQAVDLLQAVLDGEEDSTVPVGNDGTVFRSLKGQTLELLSSLPEEGQRVYELKYGVAARKRLDKSVEDGDWDAVEEIARRFFHTAAGYEATYRLAARAQDRGEPLNAAILFDQLAETAPAEQRPQLWLRSATAWTQAGFPDAAQDAVKRLAELNDAAFVLGGRKTSPDAASADVIDWLARIGASDATSREVSWPVFGQKADRDPDPQPITVAGGAEWSFPFNTTSPWDDPQEVRDASRLAATLADITATAADTGELTQPAFSPVVAGNTVIVRTLRGLQAIDVQSGQFLWRTERPHDVVYDRALDGINLFTRPSNPFESGASRSLLLDEYVAQSAWRNLTTGTLSTDGKFVYGIEGVGTAGVTANAPQGGPRNEPIGSDSFNSLYAYEIAAEGRIAWTVGGPPVRDGASGQFFLGPPLPLGGRLYALAEEEGEIRLVAINPAAHRDEDRILWTQSLVGVEAPVAARPPMVADPLRKLSGLSPSFSDGILVCPTGTGAVVAVDLGQRLLLWGYRYSRNVDARPIGGARRAPFLMVRPAIAPNDEADRWLDSYAQVADGLVYLTPRDSTELHCVDLRTGRLQWKQPRGSALYLAAVHEGRAIVSSRRSIAAYDARTGDPLWTQSLDAIEVAGRGVRNGDVYHIPLKTNEIATIQLSTGQELGRSPIGEGIAVGNLIAVNGRLISQSTDMLAGFSQREDFEADLQERLRDGSDADALALRGEHRLHRGETQSGIADLRTAVAANSHRAKTLLTAVLLEGLRSDFPAYREYEADVLEITDDPHQRLQLRRLLADGLERAGEPQEAFSRYLLLCDEWRTPPPIEMTGEGTSVRADRALRKRIAHLYADSSPSDRLAMDAALATRLRVFSSRGDTHAIERFVTLFREMPAATNGLTMLAARYQASGDRLRQNHTLRRIEERLPSSTMRRTSEPQTSSHDLFAENYQVEYIPNEIKSGHRESEAEARFTVRVIGPRPSAYANWSFEIDASRKSLRARNALGQLRWKIAVQSPLDARTPLRFVHAAQVRFNGVLMAFSAGNRLVMLETSNPAAPTVLWMRDLEDRGLAELSINRQQFRRTSLTGESGPIGFAGSETLLYQVGTMVIAADPISGETLWQRSRLPLDCSLSGDYEYVLLRPPGAADAILLRTIDGSYAAPDHLRSLDGRNPIAWQGTQIVFWSDSESGRELVCRDVARGIDLWSRSFSPAAQLERLGSDEVAVLEVETGDVQVFRLADGAVSQRVRIEPKPAGDFFPLRLEGRLLIFTRKAGREGQSRLLASAGLVPVEGEVAAFNMRGERLWSVTLPQQHLPMEQSAGLPILFLTTAVHSPDRPASHRALLLDVRSGEVLIEQRRDIPFLPFETVVDPRTRGITISVRDGRFLLTPAFDEDRR